jgi:hypothetical protein
LAELGRAADFEKYPLPDTSQLSKNSKQQVSGSGYFLPELERVQWESNGQGGFEAWYVPLGVTHRKGKTYLGFLGKRNLTAWSKSKSESEFHLAVIEWIKDKAAEKGITL